MTYQSFLKLKQKEAISKQKEENACLFYLMHITNLSSSELYAVMNEECPEDIINKYNEKFNLYLDENYPIQYLIGKQSFFGYDFIVNENVLIPRFETEELVQHILFAYDDYFEGSKVTVADVGTGSGCIGITLAKEEPMMKIIATDISNDALNVAKENAKNLGADVTFLQGDLLEPLLSYKFDILVSNPPYIPSSEEVEDVVKKNEPNIALFGGGDGMHFYRKILADSYKIIKDRALICFEYAYNKKVELSELIKTYYPYSQIEFFKDMQDKDRIVIVKVGFSQ